jgi:hypothetical protein
MSQFLFGNNKGISIVELLVGASILTMSLSALLGFLSFAVSAASFVKQQTQAIKHGQGALEALKNFRDGTSWNVDDPQNQYDGLGKVQTGVSYRMGLSLDVPSRWQLLLGTETMGLFARTIVFENVQRDVNSNIVSAGGVNDPSTKKVTVTVSWQAKTKSQEVVIVSYFTNWRQ